MNRVEKLKELRKELSILKKEQSKLEKSKVIIENKIKFLEHPEFLYQEEFYRKRKWKNQYRLGKILVYFFGIKSLIDFGCGIGGFISGVYDAGAKVAGLEIGIEYAKKYAPDNIKKFIEYADVGEPYRTVEKFDCALSIEVAEHLFEECADTFVDNLIGASSKYIVITASSKRGYYHFNPQSKEYWIDKFENSGAFYDNTLTLDFGRVWLEAGCAMWMLRNLMVFTV